MPLFGKSKAEPVYETHTTHTTTEPRRSTGGMFSSNRHSQPAPVVDDRRSSGGLFSSHKHTQPAPVVDDRRSSRGMFGRRDNSSSRSRSNSPRRRSKGTGLLSRVNHTGDPSTSEAHQRVLTAEAAEREAEKALQHARNMVRDARDHVKRLEREAAEEARLAKLKQKDSAAISKRAGKLGGL